MRRPRATAFTLIEAIIAVVVLSVAVPPMLWALREARLARADPIHTSTARWLAAEQLEDIIADRHSATRGYAWLIGANYPDEPVVPGFPVYARSVAIAETGPDLAGALPGGGYKRVSVTVTWSAAGGSPRSLSIATVLTEYP